jgi:hypothetical protein
VQCDIAGLAYRWHLGVLIQTKDADVRHALQMLALCFKLQFQHLSSGYYCYPCIQLVNIYCYCILGWTILLISLVCTRHTMRQAVGSTSQPDPFPVSLCRYAYFRLSYYDWWEISSIQTAVWGFYVVYNTLNRLHIPPQESFSVRNWEMCNILLQCATCYYSVQHVITVCNMILQCATCYYSVQHAITVCNMLLQCATCYYSVQHVITVCNMLLQCATWYYIVQYVITLCNMLLRCATCYYAVHMLLRCATCYYAVQHVITLCNMLLRCATCYYAVHHGLDVNLFQHL